MIRLLAALVLAAPTTTDLIAAANGEDTPAALSAIDALSLSAKPEAFAAVAKLVASDEEARARQAQIGLSRSPIPETALIRLLENNEDHVVKKAAAWNLGIIRSSAAVPELLATLESKDAELRAKAATALGRIADERALNPLLVVANKDKDAEARAAATAALESIADARRRPPLEPLGPMIALLDSLDPGTRRDAAKQMARRGDRRAVGPLLSAAQREGDEETRRIFIETLGGLEDPITVPYLLGQLRTARGATRYACIAAVATVRDPRATPTLSKLAVDDKDPVARKYAVRAVGWMGTDAVRDVLSRTLQDPEPQVRVETVLALESLEAKDRIPDLVARLKRDTDVAVRAETIRVLGAWRATSASKLLASFLESESKILRTAAVQALRGAGDLGSVPALEKLIRAERKKKAPDTYLIKEATQTLQVLAARYPEDR